MDPQGLGLKRIILFRFHDQYDVCINRIEYLRRFNPSSPVFGLYGGSASAFEEAGRALSGHLDGIWRIPVEAPKWKWRHGDISLALWYREVGRHIPFDMLHLAEWDLLLLGNLEDIYGRAGTEGVALVGLTPLARIQHKWHWTTKEPLATEWRQLQAHVERRYGWKGPYLACQGPGNAFSREFLERYAQEELPELVHEELRIPLYAQAWGFKVDPLPRIYREIQDPAEMTFFNCERRLIKEQVIRRQLATPMGRRVFHPYREVFQAVPPWWRF